MTQKLCTTFNPTSNSAAERLNRTILQLLRALLLEYEDKKWDDILPLAIFFYNSGYHRTLDNSPFYLMYGRDPNVPYESIISPVQHHDGTVSDRARDMARCLSLARDAISNTQDYCQTLANVKSKNRVDTGDLVYVRERHVAKRDHKLLPKYGGPLRVMELLGPRGTPGACILKSLKTGRTKQVSLRDVKLLQHHVLTKTENGNVGEAFPIVDSNADLPDSVGGICISRHSDVKYDVSDDATTDSARNGTDIPVEQVEQETPACEGVNSKALKGNQASRSTLKLAPAADTYVTGGGSDVTSNTYKAGGGSDVTSPAAMTGARSVSDTSRNPGPMTRARSDLSTPGGPRTARRVDNPPRVNRRSARLAGKVREKH